jgi:hypothetical protein
MGPPMEADLDSSCRSGGWPTWRDFKAAERYNESIWNARTLRCLREVFSEVPTAPVSEWVRVEIPKVGGEPGEYVSAFEKLEDCQMAKYLARNANSSRLGPSGRGENQELGKALDDLLSYDRDPALKGIDLSDKKKARAALESFKREHSTDDRALTYAAFTLFMLEERAQYTDCFATDDTRLRGN